MAELHDDRLDQRVRSAYRDSQERDAAAEARVLERVSQPDARKSVRPGRPAWWFETHLFELRPAPVVVLATLAIAAALWAGSQWNGPAERQADAPVAAQHDVTNGHLPGVPVTFVLRTADAARVNLVGDFNSWDADATPLVHDGSRDLWVVELELPPGMHNYAFVVDGQEWRTDPSAPLAAGATFGGRTSVLVVEEPRL
jgi:hypothetical protein